MIIAILIGIVPAMPTDYPKITFRIPEDLRGELVHMASQQGVSVSRIIKEILTNFVRQRQDEERLKRSRLKG
jgi:predicted HicB family RNase H-like nuclease